MENIRAGRRVEHFETVRRTKSGQLLDVSITVSPIKDEHGRVIGASKILRDVSTRKRLEQALLQAEKIAATGRMAATIAHEINNPNNLIMLNADVIETFYRFLSPVLRQYAEANPEWTVAQIPYSKVEGKMEILISGIAGGAKRIKAFDSVRLIDFADKLPMR